MERPHVWYKKKKLLGAIYYPWEKDGKYHVIYQGKNKIDIHEYVKTEKEAIKILLNKGFHKEQTGNP